MCMHQPDISRTANRLSNSEIESLRQEAKRDRERLREMIRQEKTGA